MIVMSDEPNRRIYNQLRVIRAAPGGGDDSREQILPTSYSPSVITTVAGNRVRGFVSQSEIEK